MERFVKGRLITHLEINNLIGDSQYGFRNKHSCLTSMLDFFAQVIDTYDADNNEVDLVYLYFQKAFDKVPHEKLMLKVKTHCILVTAARCIRNWLAGHSHGHSSTNPIATGHQSHLVYHKVVYYSHYYFLYIYIYLPSLA